MKRKEEKRKPIICSHCGHEMVCMNIFDSIYQLIRGFYVWYICPRRKGEKGCGHSIVVKLSPRTKRPGRVVESIKVKKSAQRRRRG